MSKQDKAEKTVEERLEIVEKAVGGVCRIVDKIKSALEKIMGIDIDRDGKIGSVRLSAMLLVFALCGVLMAANGVVWKVGDSAYVDEEGDATFNSVTATINATTLTPTLVSNATLKVYGNKLEIKTGGTVSVPAKSVAVASLAAADPAKIIVYNASSQAVAVAVSGDATISNAGAVTLADNAVPASEVGPGTLPNDVLLPASVTWTNTQAIVIDGTTAPSKTVTIVDGAGTGTNLVITIVDGLIKSVTP